MFVELNDGAYDGLGILFSSRSIFGCVHEFLTGSLDFQQQIFLRPIERIMAWEEESTDKSAGFYAKKRATSLSLKILEESNVARNNMSLRLAVYSCILVVAISLFVGFSLPKTGFCFGYVTNTAIEELTVVTNTVFTRRNIVLPSLNLNDYKDKPLFPVFSAFPSGIKRKHMPQFKFNASDSVWSDLTERINQTGGFVSRESVDLRIVLPLQSEISGFITYNVLFGDAGELVRESLEQDPGWFRKRIVLIRTPDDLQSADGSVISEGSLLILDGHHTTAVAQLCSELPHTMLRLGNYNDINATCGEKFDPKQELQVIEGLHPLVVRKLALESGATSGYAMTYSKG